jgi:Ca2+-binding RTX toxin-like protein
MANLYAYREMTTGLLLPAGAREAADREYFRPPIAANTTFDGFIPMFGPLSTSVALYRANGTRYVLDPALFTTSTLSEATISYSGGAWFFRYYYVAVNESGREFQKILGASLLDSDGLPVLDITPTSSWSMTPPALLMIDSITREMFVEDMEGKLRFAGIYGQTDLWQALMADSVWVSGTAQADIMQFASASERVDLDGGEGDDTLVGGTADDDLRGGEGNDRLDGGMGRDSYKCHPTAEDISVTLDGSNWATVFENGVATDVIRNIENLFGKYGNDTLVGDAFSNNLDGLVGADRLFGKGGDDILSLESYQNPVADFMDGGTGFDLVEFHMFQENLEVTLNGAIVSQVRVGGVLLDQIVNIEGVVGSYGDDVLTGDMEANILVGRFGEDVLDGRAGNDTLYPGHGTSDALVGGAGIDTVSWSPPRSDFYLAEANGDDWGEWLVTNRRVALARDTQAFVFHDGVVVATVRGVENLIGGAGSDTFTGDVLANRLEGRGGDDTFNGGAGADVLAGGDGSDSLNGGSGVDTVDYSAESQTDGSQGYYIDLSSGIAVLLDYMGGPQFVNVTGSSDNLTSIENVTGSVGGDLILGNDSPNRLLGGAGNDFLMGLGGMDTLHGGAGVDTAVFSERAVALSVTLNGAARVNVLASGLIDDVLLNIENLLGGSGGDTFVGDARTNTLMGGVGEDTLSGGGGSDMLVGGEGLDILDGGAGVDRVDYGLTSSLLGIAPVTEPVSVILQGSAVAEVWLGGTLADLIRNIENVFGGTGDDTLIGDSARNQLSGGAGVDELNGKGGSDTLLGGVDDVPDFFVFDTMAGPGNLDSVRDFVLGTDFIVLNADVFPKLAGLNEFSSLEPAYFSESWRGEALDADDYLLFNERNNLLSYDSDGSGPGAAVPVAYIAYSAGDSRYSMDASDFLIIT